jgi:hypothetical protein
MALRELVEQFQHPALSVSMSERQSLNKLDGASWKQLHQDMQSQGLHHEFSSNSSAVMLSFDSAEVVVPRTQITIAAVRFSFFYWLWYYHVCLPDQLQNRFKPSPPTTKGFFTFKPKAATDGRKIEATVRELLKRCSDDLVNWSNQLGEFVNARIEPLRKVGEIIEERPYHRMEPQH